MMNAIGRECLRDDVLGTWRASVEAGFWRSSDPVTPEEVFAYWREPWEMCVGGATVHGHPGVRVQVDRAQVLADRPLG